MRGLLGVDIDGVLTDEGDGKENIWYEEMCKWFGPLKRVTDAYEFDKAYGLSRQEVLRFFEAKAEELFARVPPRPRCIEVLESVYRVGMRVVLITARNPRYEKVTRQWLARHAVPHDKLIFAEDKTPVCLELGVDLLIDDKIGNCESAIAAGIPALCFTMDHNRRLPTRARRVGSWKEIAEYLAELFGDERLAV